MVKAQADAENHQYADHFRPRIKAVDPGIPVKVKENGHNSPSLWTYQSRRMKIDSPLCVGNAYMRSLRGF